MVVIISLGTAYGQNENPKELYNECVNVAGESLCDFLFKNSTQNVPQQDTQAQNYLPKNRISLNASNSTYLTYNDNDNGFSIEIPMNWTYGYHNSQFNTVIGMAPPDNTNAYVDIRILPKGDYKSIKEFGDENFKQNEQYTLLGYYRNSTTQLSGKPAFKAVYLGTLTLSFAQNLQGTSAEPFKGAFIGTMVPEKKSIYAIVYLANPADFDTYRPIFEKMVDSFKIYGKGPVIQEDNSSSSNP